MNKFIYFLNFTEDIFLFIIKEAKPTNEKSKETQIHYIDENYGSFQGKISYIFRLAFTTINLYLSEAYVQNSNKLLRILMNYLNLKDRKW